MYIVLITIHIIVCFILILTILLQAGRGGGLTEAFGGDAAQSILGTQAPVLLKKITEVSAIVFLVTSLLLGVFASRGSRSMIPKMSMPNVPVTGSYTAPIAAGDMTTVSQAPAMAEETEIPEELPLAGGEDQGY